MYAASYSDSRDRFRSRLPSLQLRWPGARLAAHHLSGDEDLTIDWISAPAHEHGAKLVILTTGQHGAEGYVGAAMLELFLDEFAGRLDPAGVGLLLVHAINPWGMQHGRRVNRANVDLNRNFWWPTFPSPAPISPGYARLNDFLNPQGPVEHLTATQLSFLANLATKLLKPGTAQIRAATLMGQYEFANGIYFGGAETQEETRVMTALYADHLDRHRRVLHIDLHTGYGPRDQMTIVNSALDPRDPAELKRRFDYPLVVRTTPGEFYAINGDMIDYVNALAQARGRADDVYSTTFEFGTFGESLPATVRSLRTMILENRLWRFGGSDAAKASIAHDFRELFAPSSPAWQAKAREDAQRAFAGILKAEGF